MEIFKTKTSSNLAMKCVGFFKFIAPADAQARQPAGLQRSASCRALFIDAELRVLGEKMNYFHSLQLLED